MKKQIYFLCIQWVLCSQFLSTMISNNCTYSPLHASHPITKLSSQSAVLSISVYQSLTLSIIPFLPILNSACYNRLPVHWCCPTSSLQPVFSPLASLCNQLWFYDRFFLNFIVLSPIPESSYYIPLAKAHSYISPTILSPYAYILATETTGRSASL